METMELSGRNKMQALKLKEDASSSHTPGKFSFLKLARNFKSDNLADV